VRGDLEGWQTTKNDRLPYHERMLVLASQSPRRSEILRQAGIPFTVRVAAVDETPLDGEKPQDYVVRLAELKATAVPAGPDETVLGADTTRGHRRRNAGQARGCRRRSAHAGAAFRAAA